MVELAQAVVWHRQVAALAAAADRVGVAEQDLPTVRARLASQRALFAQAAARTGMTLAALTPTPTEVSAAAPALGDLSAETVAETFRTSYSTLDAVDGVLATHLAPAAPPTPAAAPRLAPTGHQAPGPGQATATGTPPPTAAPVPPARGPVPPAGGPVPPGPVPPTTGLVPPAPPPGAPGYDAPVPYQGGPPGYPPPIPPTGVSGWPPGIRNALVYGGYAFTVLLVQLALFAVVDDEQTLPLLAPLCLFVLPAFAWAAGWFTVGLAFRSPPGGPKLKRSPRIGAVVCLLPNVFLCAGLGILFLAR